MISGLRAVKALISPGERSPFGADIAAHLPRAKVESPPLGGTEKAPMRSYLPVHPLPGHAFPIRELFLARDEPPNKRVKKHVTRLKSEWTAQSRGIEPSHLAEANPTLPGSDWSIATTCCERSLERQRSQGTGSQNPDFADRSSRAWRRSSSFSSLWKEYPTSPAK